MSILTCGDNVINRNVQFDDLIPILFIDLILIMIIYSNFDDLILIIYNANQKVHSLTEKKNRLFLILISKLSTASDNLSVDNSEIKIKNNLFSDTEHGALIDLRARPPQVKIKILTVVRIFSRTFLQLNRLGPCLV